MKLRRSAPNSTAATGNKIATPKKSLAPTSPSTFPKKTSKRSKVETGNMGTEDEHARLVDNMEECTENLVSQIDDQSPKSSKRARLVIPVIF